VLAEAYSTLTAVPGLRIKPAAANSLVGRLVDRLEYAPVSLAAQMRALETCSRLGLTSGAIFDAVIMATAEEAGADMIVTFNCA
jgi:predicted nucleic acid-binding protein